MPQSTCISKPTNIGQILLIILPGDQLKVVAMADNTVARMYRRHENGTVSRETFRLNRGEAFTRDVISDNTYRLTSNQKIFVAQVMSSSLITIERSNNRTK